MTLRSHPFLFILFTSALLAACSRPTALYQSSKAERFYTQQPAEPVPGVNPASPGPGELVVTANVPVAARQPISAQSTPPNEALVSLKNTQPLNARTRQRMNNAQDLLAETNQKTAPATSPGIVKKLSLVQRLTLNHIDKTLKKHLAPRQGQALTGYVRLGLIIAAIGLILLLIGNSLGTLLGLLGLLGGLALVVVGLLQQ